MSLSYKPNNPMHAEPATLRNLCGVASLFYHKNSWPGEWSVSRKNLYRVQFEKVLFAKNLFEE